MPHPFPHQYEVALSWKGGEKSEISSPGRAPIAAGNPPEFDGTDAAVWSPEHLLLGALCECLMLTWRALNKRSGIELKSWDATGHATLDKTREGLIFTALHVKVRLSVPADRAEEAKKLVETAKKYCIVANALKTPSTVEAEVVPS